LWVKEERLKTNFLFEEDEVQNKPLRAYLSLFEPILDKAIKNGSYLRII